MLRLLHRQGSAPTQLLVDESLPQVVADLAVMLLKKPVRRCRVHPRAPVHIFTDGAAEEGEPASAAGMIYDPESGFKQYFSYRIPADLLGRWLEDRTQCINQVELHPVAVATGIWKSVLADRDAIFWIDNEAARFGLIRGSSAVDVSQELITETWGEISSSQIYPWFERVPSSGNPADAPSRGAYEWLRARGFIGIDVM